MSPKIILLTGMPGVGKTYWGKKWAMHYDWDFIDLDEEIELKSGLSIDQLFAQKGEAYFRSLESQVLIETIRAISADTIIATGGGCVVAEENRAIMEAHCVVWLKASLSLLEERLQKDTQIRPLLLQPLMIDQLKQLFESRKSFYAMADLQLDVQHLTLQSFQTILDQCISSH